MLAQWVPMPPGARLCQCVSLCLHAFWFPLSPRSSFLALCRRFELVRCAVLIGACCPCSSNV
eukprot:1728212-Alexandrium_andersonii.AAC.1